MVAITRPASCVQPVSEGEGPRLDPHQWALVVEPDADIGRAVSDALTTTGLAARVASDGVEALFAVQNPVPPALVVLDWEAEQNVSGERLFTLLRNDPHTERVPVIVLADAPVSASWFANRHQPLPEAFLKKPLDAADIAVAATHLLLAQNRGSLLQSVV